MNETPEQIAAVAGLEAAIWTAAQAFGPDRSAVEDWSLGEWFVIAHWQPLTAEAAASLIDEDGNRLDSYTNNMPLGLTYHAARGLLETGIERLRDG